VIAKNIAVALVLSALCLPVAAQWFNYPSPGIPRTPDGKPDLAASASHAGRQAGSLRAYTKPWIIQVQVHQSLAVDTDLLEFFCTDNEKDARHLIGN